MNNARSGLRRSAVLLLLGVLLTLSGSTPRAQAAYAQRVRVGSTTSYTDAAANLWAADRAYVPGSFGYTTGDAYVTGAAIANTPDGALLRANRHAAAFGYRFDVPNGVYQVRLRFAEIYPGSFVAGARVFNVSLETTPVLQNFDVFARVGGNAALDQLFTTTVADGVLSIDFSGLVGHAEVNAIEVLALGGTPEASTTPTPTSTSSSTPTATSTSTLPLTTPTSTATSAPTPTPTPTPAPPSGAGGASQTVTFDDLRNPNHTFVGLYPAGVIDWGSTGWYLSGPWGLFPTNSVGFNGPGPTNSSFAFVGARRLVQVQAYNGGAGASNVTLGCAGQLTRQTSVPVRQVQTIATGWTGACSPVTVTSSNGWNTNFDSFTVDGGPGDFGVSVSPSTQTMNSGGTAHYQATIELTGGLSPSSVGLWISGLPSGVSGYFTPTVLSQPGTSELTLSGTGAAAGTYALIVGATADGVSHSQPVQLTVPGQPAYACTMVIGFSQTNQWFTSGTFEPLVGDAQWELKWLSGGSIDHWVDPADPAWDATVVSPCTVGRDAPDRVVMNVSGDYSADVQSWISRTSAVLANIRARYPTVRQIVLQPVVGGPGGAQCIDPLTNTVVRASFNAPYITQALLTLVGGDVGMGPQPEVRTCADYVDNIGHLQNSAFGAIASAIAAYYVGQP
jgi:hypothetical protein